MTMRIGRPRAWRTAGTVLALVAFAARVAGAQQADPSTGERVRVVLLHDNDTHFHDNHRDAVRTYVEAVRATGLPVFLLSAGDIVVRNPERWPEPWSLDWYRGRGIEMLEWMNELEYDAAVVGNHELAPLGSATREILERAAFPVITANIRNESDRLPAFDPYVVLKVPAGPSLAVLGLTVINFDPIDGLEQLDYEETVRGYLHLADEYDALVLLTHIGIRYDLDLANAIPEVAAIIGGHTNTLLGEAVHVNGVLVAQAGGHSHVRDEAREMFMGTVVLEFEGGDLVASCGYVVRIGPGGVRPAAAAAPAPDEAPLQQVATTRA